MCDKENIEIFEQIWEADIINKTEPLYSVAISVAQFWTRPGYQGIAGITPLYLLLLRRLLNNWEHKLLEHINHHPVVIPAGQNMSEFFRSLRDKYKDSPQLLTIVNKLIKDITSDPDSPKQEHQHLDPSCIDMH